MMSEDKTAEAVAFCAEFEARVSFGGDDEGKLVCIQIAHFDVNGHLARSAFGRTLAGAYEHFQRRFSLPFKYEAPVPLPSTGEG